MAKSAFKASKSKTKLAPLARKTQANKCDLGSQSSVNDESVRLPSSVVRQVCPNPPTGRANVSGCDPLNHSSVTSWSTMSKHTEVRQVILRVLCSAHCRMPYKCSKCDY